MSEKLVYKFGYPKHWTPLQRLKARKSFFDALDFDALARSGFMAAFRNPDRSNPGPWKFSTDPNQSLEEIYATLHADNGAMHEAEAETRREWDDHVRTNKVRRPKAKKPKKPGKKISKIPRRKKDRGKVRSAGMERRKNAKAPKVRKGRNRKAVRAKKPNHGGRRHSRAKTRKR